MNVITVLACVAVVYLLIKIAQVLRELLSPPPAEAKFTVGDITAESLRYYSGRDWAKPLLLAVSGAVYDATNALDDFGPGKPRAAYAGRECARYVALGGGAAAAADAAAATEADLGRADYQDLGPEGAARVAALLDELRAKGCHEAGRVVPLRDVAPEELAASDGTDPARPMLISIRGVVYDVTRGKDFYGPGGVYPFAGREVARAFAMLSTELSDCHDNLDGLAQIELDNLKEWEDKFNWKYPIIGRLTGKALAETAGQRAAAAAGGEGAGVANGGGEARRGAAQAAAAVFGR